MKIQIRIYLRNKFKMIRKKRNLNSRQPVDAIVLWGTSRSKPTSRWASVGCNRHFIQCQWWCQPWACSHHSHFVKNNALRVKASVPAWNAVINNLKSLWVSVPQTKTLCITSNGCSRRCCSRCKSPINSSKSCHPNRSVLTKTRVARFRQLRVSNQIGTIDLKAQIKGYRTWLREKLN